MVLRSTAVGDNDSRRNALPLSTKHGTIIQLATKWTSDGKTILLLVRNVNFLTPQVFLFCTLISHENVLFADT